jgi:xylulokinase
MANYLLGIDLGTSSCKTVLFTIDFKMVCASIKEYPISFPRKNWAEQSATLWWEAVIFNIRQIISKSCINPANIIGIGVDSQGSVVLPVDKQGEALRPGLIWMDRRSEEQCRWMDRNLQKQLWEINGNHNDPSNIAPKIIWIKENEPEVYKNTYQFLHANGYLVLKLTGKFSMDISEGGLTQLFDTKRGCWSDELIYGCNIERNKLPDIYNCYDIVGNLTKDVAKITGLTEGIPVIAGAMDMVASALGAGVYIPGQVYIAAGTVTAAGVCLDKPQYNPALHIYHHIIPDRWLTAAGVDFGGGGLKWFRDLLEYNDYNTIEKLINLSNPENNRLIFLPYMVGQRAPLWNSNTRGVIFGLNPDLQKQDLVRMFMEGNAFGMRFILDIIRKTGVAINDIRMTGGCTNIEKWPQIFADITGKNIEIPAEIDVAALGTAVTVGVGIGVYSGFEEIVSKFSINKTYQPQWSLAERYQRMYDIYCRLYLKLKDEFDALAELE